MELTLLQGSFYARKSDWERAAKLLDQEGHEGRRLAKAIRNGLGSHSAWKYANYSQTAGEKYYLLRFRGGSVDRLRKMCLELEAE